MTQTDLFPPAPIDPIIREQLKVRVSGQHHGPFCRLISILAQRGEYIYLDEDGVPAIQSVKFAVSDEGLQAHVHVPVLRESAVVATLSIDLGDVRDLHDGVFMLLPQGSRLWLRRERYAEHDAGTHPGVTTMLARLHS